MLDGEETVEIAWGELRREGARQHAGRRGNCANSLGRASPGGSETACWTERKLCKSAHTALAVKACLLGGNSNTKCSMTFVNIAVAISALAGGAAKTVSHRDQNTVVFSAFFEDFWVSERKRVLKWNFGSFW